MSASKILTYLIAIHSIIDTTREKGTEENINLIWIFP